MQFVHPGFLMPDEAVVPYYESMENIEVGLHFLRDTFGISPHIYWDLDSFGYSAYSPVLFNKYGIDTVFLSRIGNYNKNITRSHGLLNFIWEGHPVNGINNYSRTFVTFT